MADNSKPILQIYNANNTAPQESWNAGELDVSNPDAYVSGNLVINVWNNKGRNTAVPDLVGCNITTKNINGDNTDEQVVTEKWVHACVDSMSSSFSPIGGNTVLPIAHQNASSADRTKGTANNGSTSATNNYAKITLKIVPGINASREIHYFKTRVSGYYV